METLKGIFSEKINKQSIYDNVIEKAQGKKKLWLKYSAIPICMVVLLGTMLLPNLEPLKEENIFVNEVSEIDAALLDIDIKWADEVNAIAFAALDSLEIPEDLTEQDFGEAYSRNGKSGEYDILAWYSYVYQNSTGERWISIDFSDKQQPARCYVFEGGKPSQIYDTEIMIYKYEDAYIAEFEKEGIYYGIETSGIEEKELMEFISSIVR